MLERLPDIHIVEHLARHPTPAYLTIPSPPFFSVPIFGGLQLDLLRFDAAPLIAFTAITYCFIWFN